MMFIYFGENGKYTKYMCICNMCTEKEINLKYNVEKIKGF